VVHFLQFQASGSFVLHLRFVARYTESGGQRAAKEGGMASSVPEFWQLVEQSRLLAGEQCRQLHQEFQATNGSTDHTSPRMLGEWLVSRNIFSRYQVTVLLAGRPGPFVYGDYKIYDRVEAGRLANEFRAVHAAAGHPVLLRFLTGPIVQDAGLWAATATEAQIACSLNHSHLQRLFELVDLGSFKYLVEEDLHGETLAERLAAGRMPPHEACRVARCMAQGLAALHATGRPHGDVRPLNVWLESASPHHPGDVKLLRDPLVPPAPPNFAAHDAQGWLLAQSDYLAPEFQMPGKSPDALTDLYALGCTLYHMLAGHPPFPGGSAMQKMARHAGEAIRPLELYGVPQPLAQLATFLMAKNPTLRYQDAQTVADQLVAFVDPAVVHVPPLPALPTLPAYEAAVRQSHSRLAMRTVQSAFGVPAPTEVAVEPAPAPIIRTADAPGSIPVGTVPKGKVVAAAPAEAAFVPREADAAKGVVEAKINDPALLAAKEARERKRLIITLVSVGVAAVALIIGVNMMRGKNDQAIKPDTPTEEPDVPELENNIGVVSKPEEPDKAIKLPDNLKPETTPPTTKSGQETPAAVETGPTYDVVADDGKLPWASPTSGKPIDLTYVPPLAGVMIVVRAAELLSTEEGAKVLKSLGPKFEVIRSGWEKSAAIKLEDCQQLIVSLHDNENAFPKVSVVVRLKNAIAGDELAANWGAELQKEEGKEFYSNASWAYYLPAEENGTLLLMADVAGVKDIIKNPVWARTKRELEQVRRNTDADRHMTVLFDPMFLFSGEGDPLFAGDFIRVKEPLQWLLGDGLQAGALSMHFGEAFYAELRVQTKVDKPPRELADDFRKRMEEVPGKLKNYFVNQLDPPPYWKALAFDFPGMVRLLHDNCRVGMESNQAIVNVYLPAPAAHNLVLGTELAIATAPGASTAVAAKPVATPKTLEDVLNLKMKEFSFDSTTFDAAILDVERESRDLAKGAVEYSFVIIGDDLEIGGITRNRSLQNFKMVDKSVADVLTGLCLANNNIPGVKSPTEENQKLVWCVAEEGGMKKVFITTRDGAAKREYKLPAVFESK
jgi:serine/threonine-protein kinase